MKGGGSAVLRSTRGEIAERLMKNRQFTPGRVAAFFVALALPDRQRWNKAPHGYANRDWYPWRFRRRLALSVRPLVVLGGEADSPVFCGMYQVGASISYLFDGIRHAWFPVEFFRSDGMRRYRGAIADTLGNEFTLEVGRTCGELGWYNRTEVEMGTIGAAADLGDLDVVCWRTGDERLLLIECKRLQPARTIGEIVEQLSQFRGESGDRLERHLRRCDWVRENLSRVRQQLQVPKTTTAVVPVLVTNTEVPMQFRKGLPLPPGQIAPLRSLPERLRHVAG